MRHLFFFILLFAVTLVPVASLAQDDAPLPRVLIIGDAVYGHARGVSADLKDKAQVSFANFPAGVVLNSSSAIEHLDLLLGRIDGNDNPVPKEKWTRWDLIVFNVGLGDLIHCVPDIKSLRVLPIHVGGVKATDAKQYEKNLHDLVGQLKAKTQSAKLVWASTTPIRASSSNVFEMGSEIQYNEIAAGVMKQHGVSTCDMYGYVKELIDMDKPAGHGADPFHFDKKPIHGALVESIREALNLPAPPKPDASAKAKD